MGQSQSASAGPRVPAPPAPVAAPEVVAAPTAAPAPPTELHPERLFSDDPAIVRSELDAASTALNPEQFAVYVNTVYYPPILPSDAMETRRGMTPLAFRVFDGYIDDDQARYDARFEILQMYLQIPGIDVNNVNNAFRTKTLVSSAIEKQHERYIEDRVIEALLAHPSTDLVTSSPLSCALVGNRRHVDNLNPRDQYAYPPVTHDLTIVKAILSACKARGTDMLHACVNTLGVRSMMSPLFSAAKYVLFAQENGRPADVEVYTEIVDALLEHGARIRDGSQPENLVNGEFVFTLPIMHGTDEYVEYGRHPFAMSQEEFTQIVSFVEARKGILQKRKRVVVAQSLPNILPPELRERVAHYTVGGGKGRKTRRHKKRSRKNTSRHRHKRTL